jgi:hypothetical protein
LLGAAREFSPAQDGRTLHIAGRNIPVMLPSLSTNEKSAPITGQHSLAPISATRIAIESILRWTFPYEERYEKKAHRNLPRGGPSFNGNAEVA